MAARDHCDPDGTSDPGAPVGRHAPHSRKASLLVLTALTLVLVGASLVGFASLRPGPEIHLQEGGTVYFNEACGDCAIYLEGELRPSLVRANVPRIVVKDYINDPSARSELTAINDALGIPFELQSHLATFVVGETVTAFEGHVPAALIEEALALPPAERPPELLVYQDRMDGAESYRAWGFAGEPQTYPLRVPLAVYVSWFRDRVEAPAVGPGGGGLVPLVLAAGLLDGLNPCAFAVLLFFVSFLYAVRIPRIEALRVGSAYAYAVFLAYFLIGLGLLRAIVVSEDPHLIAKLAAIAVIVLGALALLRVVAPRLPSLTTMPASWPRIKAWILRGSAPSAAAAGLLVGLCTFPCSGGVYVAVLGLLATRTTFLEGLGYLYLYNAMYIVPLVVVLAAISNRRTALAAARWERGHVASLRVALAAGMIAMGALILVVSG